MKLKPNYGELNGYSEEAQTQKNQFLRDAKRLLVEAGKRLAKTGLTGSRVSVNPAGIAVSGDVWVHYWNPNEPGFCVTCWITASAIGVRADRVMITARKDEWKEETSRKKKTTWRAGHLGTNRDIPTDLDSTALADALEQIFVIGDYVHRTQDIEVVRPPSVFEAPIAKKAELEMVQLSLFEAAVTA